MYTTGRSKLDWYERFMAVFLVLGCTAVLSMAIALATGLWREVLK